MQTSRRSPVFSAALVLGSVLATQAAPPARAAASMAYDAPTHRLVLFGGFDGAHYLGDTWLFDGANSSSTQASPSASPTPATAPMLFTDPLNGRADVHGGHAGMFYQSTSWQWTGTSWQQLFPVHSPSARSSAVVALDRAHGNVLLFGGLASVNPWNTWTWDGLDWHLQSPSVQPPNRYDSSVAFEPHIASVVMFGGGSGGSDISDTWRWTGSDWQELHPVHSPAPRESFAMQYLPSLGRIVISGGEGATLFSETWDFAVRP